MIDPRTGIDPEIPLDRVVSSTSYWPARPTLRARIREAGGDGPSWPVIIIAALAAVVTVILTWNGVLFG